MPMKCSVPNCKSGYKTCTEKVSLFRLPLEEKLFEKWKVAINRQDRIITRKDHICEKHFAEEDIIRYWVYNNLKEKLKVPRLKKDAIPCIFPERLPKVKKIKIKGPRKKMGRKKKPKRNPLCKSEILPLSITFFDQLWNNELMVIVPSSSWALHRVHTMGFRTIIIADVMITDNVPFFHKQIILNEDNTINLIVGTTVLSPEDQVKHFGKIVQFYSITDMNEIIKSLHLLNFVLANDTYVTEIFAPA